MALPKRKTSTARKGKRRVDHKRKRAKKLISQISQQKHVYNKA